jgi:hypothetical protein
MTSPVAGFTLAMPIMAIPLLRLVVGWQLTPFFEYSIETRQSGKDTKPL